MESRNQESENWFDLLKTSIERRGYHQSQDDPCVFYKRTHLFYLMLMIV